MDEFFMLQKAVVELKNKPILQMIIIKEIQDEEEVQDIWNIRDSTPMADVLVGMKRRKNKKQKTRRTEKQNIEAGKIDIIQSQWDCQ